MNYEVVTLSEKIVVGLSCKTGNNDPEMSAKIGGLWQKFYGNGIFSSISNRVNENSIGLYSDYTKDGYTVTVGNEVSLNENNNLAYKVIPAGKYAKFSIKGHMVTAVQQAWSEIWKLDLNRSFIADFEEYLNADVDNADIDIYISLKEE